MLDTEPCPFLPLVDVNFTCRGLARDREDVVTANYRSFVEGTFCVSVGPVGPRGLPVHCKRDLYVGTDLRTLVSRHLSSSFLLTVENLSVLESSPWGGLLDLTGALGNRELVTRRCLRSSYRREAGYRRLGAVRLSLLAACSGSCSSFMYFIAFCPEPCFCYVVCV